MEIIYIVFILFAGQFLGSLIGVILTHSKKFLYHMLSFSAGIMMAISLLVLLPESIELSSVPITVTGMGIGSAIMHLSRKAVKYVHPNPKDTLKHTAFLLFMGIFIHNFSEGMAVAIGSVSGIKIGFAVALAIAIHDIPEGICTAFPYYYSLKSRLKAFLISSSVVIPTIMGFILGYLFYRSIPLYAVGMVISATAGIMLYISADELIPVSKNSTQHTILPFMIGVALVVLLEMLPCV